MNILGISVCGSGAGTFILGNNSVSISFLTILFLGNCTKDVTVETTVLGIILTISHVCCSLKLQLISSSAKRFPIEYRPKLPFRLSHLKSFKSSIIEADEIWEWISLLI